MNSIPLLFINWILLLKPIKNKLHKGKNNFSLLKTKSIIKIIIITNSINIFKIYKKYHLLKKIKNPLKKPSLLLISIKESWKSSKNKSTSKNSKRKIFHFKLKKKRKFMLKNNPKNKTLKILFISKTPTKLNFTIL